MISETECSNCEGLTDVCISLECFHALCVSCAASMLHESHSPNNRSIWCEKCRMTTVLKEDSMMTIEAFLLTNSTRFAEHPDTEVVFTKEDHIPLGKDSQNPLSNRPAQDRSRIERLLDKLNQFDQTPSSAPKNNEDGSLNSKKNEGAQEHPKKSLVGGKIEKEEFKGTEGYQSFGLKEKEKSPLSEFEKGLFKGVSETFDKLQSSIHEMKATIQEIEALFVFLAKREESEDKKKKARDILVELSVICKANIDSLYIQGVCEELQRLLHQLNEISGDSLVPKGRKTPSDDVFLQREQELSTRLAKNQVESHSNGVKKAFGDQVGSRMSEFQDQMAPGSAVNEEGFECSRLPRGSRINMIERENESRRQINPQKDLETTSQQERLSQKNGRDFEFSGRRNQEAISLDPRSNQNQFRSHEASMTQSEVLFERSGLLKNTREVEEELLRKENQKEEWKRSYLASTPPSAGFPNHSQKSFQEPKAEGIPAIDDIQARLEHLRSLRGEIKLQMERKEDDEESLKDRNHLERTTNDLQYSKTSFKKDNPMLMRRPDHHENPQIPKYPQTSPQNQKRIEVTQGSYPNLNSIEEQNKFGKGPAFDVIGGETKKDPFGRETKGERLQNQFLNRDFFLQKPNKQEVFSSSARTQGTYEAFDLTGNTKQFVAKEDPNHKFRFSPENEASKLGFRTDKKRLSGTIGGKNSQFLVDEGHSLYESGIRDEKGNPKPAGRPLNTYLSSSNSNSFLNSKALRLGQNTGSGTLLRESGENHFSKEHFLPNPQRDNGVSKAPKLCGGTPKELSRTLVTRDLIASDSPLPKQKNIWEKLIPERQVVENSKAAQSPPVDPLKESHPLWNKLKHQRNAFEDAKTRSAQPFIFKKC